MVFGTGKTDIIIHTKPSLDFGHVVNLIKRANDECTQRFRRFKYKCEFVIKFIHATHGNTNYFTLTNKFKNQYEELNEANE